MEKRILGRTGLDVSVVGMGGLFVSRLGGTGREDARRAVQRALALGVNYVDTAPTYADSEEVLAPPSRNPGTGGDNELVSVREIYRASEEGSHARAGRS